MLQKLSMVGVSDSTGAGWLQTFHLYRGSWRRYSSFGDFIKLSVKTVVTYPRFIRGRRYRPLRAGFVVRGLVVNVVSWRRFNDFSRFQFLTNNILIIKRRGTFKTKHFYTPLSRLIRRRQYRSLFKSVF